ARMSQTAVTVQPGTAAQPVTMPEPRLPRPIMATRTVRWTSNGTPIIDFWPGLRPGAAPVAAAAAGAAETPAASAPVATAPPSRSRRETAAISDMTATLLDGRPASLSVEDSAGLVMSCQYVLDRKPFRAQLSNQRR